MTHPHRLMSPWSPPDSRLSPLPPHRRSCSLISSFLSAFLFSFSLLFMSLSSDGLLTLKLFSLSCSVSVFHLWISFSLSPLQTHSVTNSLFSSLFVLSASPALQSPSSLCLVLAWFSSLSCFRWRDSGCFQTDFRQKLFCKHVRWSSWKHFPDKYTSGNVDLVLLLD